MRRAESKLTEYTRQPSLLDFGQPEFDSEFLGVRRTELGDGAWIDHQPQWLKGHLAVFDKLLESTRWRRQERRMYERIVEVPRLIAGIPADGPGLPLLDEMASALSNRYGFSIESIMLAYYRDGKDSVAWHADKVSRRAQSLAATVSTGEPRSFRIRRKGSSRNYSFSLGWGDLTVMGGSCQRTCEHTVPKTRNAGPRIPSFSVTFTTREFSA